MEELNPEKLLVKVAAILNQQRIRYFVTGGFAVSIWGRPRATFDVDIVIHLISPQVGALIKALYGISKAGYIDEEMAYEAIKIKREFNFIDSDTGLKIDFIVSKDDDFTYSQFKRRKMKIIGGEKIYFISPEDLILAKLNWCKQTFSDRQLADVESIFKISGKKLDRRYLKTWAPKLRVEEYLNKFL